MQINEEYMEKSSIKISKSQNHHEAIYRSTLNWFGNSFIVVSMQLESTIFPINKIESVLLSIMKYMKGRFITNRGFGALSGMQLSILIIVTAAAFVPSSFTSMQAF